MPSIALMYVGNCHSLFRKVGTIVPVCLDVGTLVGTIVPSQIVVVCSGPQMSNVKVHSNFSKKYYRPGFQL